MVQPAPRRGNPSSAGPTRSVVFSGCCRRMLYRAMRCGVNIFRKFVGTTSFPIRHVFLVYDKMEGTTSTSTWSKEFFRNLCRPYQHGPNFCIRHLIFAKTISSTLFHQLFTAGHDLIPPSASNIRHNILVPQIVILKNPTIIMQEELLQPAISPRTGAPRRGRGGPAPAQRYQHIPAAQRRLLLETLRTENETQLGRLSDSPPHTFSSIPDVLIPLTLLWDVEPLFFALFFLHRSADVGVQPTRDRFARFCEALARRIKAREDFGGFECGGEESDVGMWSG